jgi:hypothetical protein
VAVRRSEDLARATRDCNARRDDAIGVDN